MAGYEIVDVAIAPQATVEANLMEKVAAILNKDPYDTSLLLTGGIPRIIAHCHNTETAESIAQSLRDLGLIVIVCKDSELRKPSQSFTAHALEFRDEEVLFRDRAGQVRRMDSRDVFLIIKGRIRTYTEAKTIKNKMKFSLAATLLTGGIPIWRKVKEETTVVSHQAELFIRLYDRKSAEPRVKMFQHYIDYSFLGAKITSSSLINFDALMTQLRGVFPQAIFDDRLAKRFGADVPSTKVGADLDINCKLIYLYHLNTSSPNPPQT